VIDNGAWSVGGNLNIQGKQITPGNYSESEVVVDGGTLDITSAVNIAGAGALTYKSHHASNTTYTISGGSSTKFTFPPPPYLVTASAGRMTFENIVHANSATFNVGGGTGDGAPGGTVTFKGNSSARDAEFWNQSGIGGDSLRISNPVVVAGTGGRVIFQDNSYAYAAHFRNDGVAAHGASDSGGSTYFRNNSDAFGAVFDNYGSTLQSYSGAIPAPGGRTAFFDSARAGSARFNNYPGQGMGSLGAGVTVFSGNSTA